MGWISKLKPALALIAGSAFPIVEGGGRGSASFEILALSYLFVHLGEIERKAFMTN